MRTRVCVCLRGRDKFCSVAAEMKACLHTEAQCFCDDGHVTAQPRLCKRGMHTCVRAPGSVPAPCTAQLDCGEYDKTGEASGCALARSAGRNLRPRARWGLQLPARHFILCLMCPRCKQRETWRAADRFFFSYSAPLVQKTCFRPF